MLGPVDVLIRGGIVYDGTGAPGHASTVRDDVTPKTSGSVFLTDALAKYVGRYREPGFTEFIFGWPTVRGASSPEGEALLERLRHDVIRFL